jgi:predicted Mrr-cat superfamily restriction endonuclease
MSRAWSIKLGSGGTCVPFCEQHGIVGIGWRMVDAKIAATASRNDLRRHVSEVCPWYETERVRGGATGQILRFAQVCQPGDYVLYYVPSKKHVVFCRVVSGAFFRDFDMENPADIFHCRRVEYARQPVSILDLYGPLKGQLLGPRMSFWEIRPYEAVHQIAMGASPSIAAAGDPELETAFHQLRDLLLARAEALTDKDWEWLVVDYFKAQGAHIDERQVGGSRAIIDAEALFDHGELGQEIWRIQVKRYQGKQVDWPAIERDFEHVGSDVHFCYVSVYGFTDGARTRADAEGVHLMDAADFARFLLTGKIRETLATKLKIPALAGTATGHE